MIRMLCTRDNGTDQQLNIMKKPATRAAYAFQFLGHSGVGDADIAGGAMGVWVWPFSTELPFSIRVDIVLPLRD